MRNAGAALFPVALMGLLAAGTFWLNSATQVGGGRDGKGRHDPDYIVDDFTIRRFDSTGALQHFLTGDKMLHYPDDESTEVMAPKLKYFRNPPIHVFSQKAWLDKDGRHVKLEGDVRVIREGLDGNPPTEIDTTVLFAVPDDSFAHTDAPVVITQGQSVLHGTGMETNDNTQISVLYGRASGTIFKKSDNQADSAHGKK